MPSDKESSPGGGGFNITTILAFLTVAASILLVSRQLSSDRPVAAAGKSQGTIGDQKVEARLWEDPFAVWYGEKEHALDILPSNCVSDLQSQIRSRNTTDGGAPLLLPVMLDNGAYSEDREGRVRSRFAIVSALGESAYVPEDAEHIGAARWPWPTSARIASFSTNDEPLASLVYSNADTVLLRLSYEWYRPRTFSPLSKEKRPNILVLWLDEDQFDDQPLLRLTLLLDSLTDFGTNHSCLATNVALIGPRRSGTLQHMLPEWSLSGQTNVDGGYNTNLLKKLTNTLQHVDLLLATPAAMDEVMVRTNSYPAVTPRSVVANLLLTNNLFRSVRNYAATDSQLAEEILNELALRNVILTGPNPQHLVLISEWDTFYGRMLSLTYAAQLATVRSNCTSYTRADFITNYLLQGESIWPSNLDSFVYLRGLDGQTTANNTDTANHNDDSSWSRQARPASPQELKRWTPDANKAEGPAQFDYLSRLGDRIAEREREVRQKGSSIGAIGIVGSDVYDTLLILQALRPRFPDAVFFTTDLDARFWHPSEWEWSRNLVVASGYGLQLSRDVQKHIPPFRDSSQTALFAATLAALNDPHLRSLPRVPVRRFEIGRSGPIDLSVHDEGTLHPARFPDPPTPYAFWMVLVAIGSALYLAAKLYRPMERLIGGANQFHAEGLWLREEDIGGLEGFFSIEERLHNNSDPLVTLMIARYDRLSKTSAARVPTDNPPDNDGMLQLAYDEGRMQEFLDSLNEWLERDAWLRHKELNSSTFVSEETKASYPERQTEGGRLGRFSFGHPLLIREGNRRILDDVLSGLLDPLGSDPQNMEDDASFTVLRASASARRAAWARSQHQHRFEKGFRWVVFVGALLALFLLILCWRDTYCLRDGEPFSLFSGTSIWPSEWFRLLALAMALGFVLKSYTSLREGVLEITRRYRLLYAEKPPKTCWRLPAMSSACAVVSANRAWKQYQQLGRWHNRRLRIIGLLVPYFLFGFCIAFLHGLPTSPARGVPSRVWDHAFLLFSVVAFVFLNFWTMDAARLCRWFIEQISEAPTRYPLATRIHFSRLRGGVPEYALNEWLDVQIIAEITDHVGRLIYYPFIVYFVMLVARHNWWDHWTWSMPLVVIFALNLALAVASVVILQRAARRAREHALSRLEAKLNEMRQVAAHTAKEKEQQAIEQAEKLLEEMRQINSGAFAGFWGNPIIGALLVPSGGTAIIELISYLTGR